MSFLQQVAQLLQTQQSVISDRLKERNLDDVGVILVWPV